MGKCIVCGKECHTELHHIIPICYGGDKNGKLVELCESCHFNIHKTAESISAKTVESKNWFGNFNLLKKASVFIKAIIEAKRNYQEGNVSQDLRKRRMIVVEMSDFEWKRLHKAKSDKGYTNLVNFIQDYLVSLTRF
jgi:hypothetical protein